MPVANKPINNSSISIFEGRKIAFVAQNVKANSTKTEQFIDLKLITSKLLKNIKTHIQI